MKSAKTVLSTALFGLALSVATVGFAEPQGDAPGASPAEKPGKPSDSKPGNSKPGDRNKAQPPGPDKNGPPRGPRPPGERRGDRGGPDGDRDDGKGARRDRDGMGPPGDGRGPDGDGPAGKRRAELEKKAKDGSLTDEEKSELETLRERGPRRGLHRAERIARLKELAEKEKDGALSDEEKAQLDRLKKVQARHDALKKRHAAHKSDRKKRKHEAKRKALKAFPGIGKHPAAQKEYEKHARRMARLERARDVAAAEERTELVTRIDELIAKEKARHEKWLAQHRSAKDGAKDDAAEGTQGEQP